MDENLELYSSCATVCRARLQESIMFYIYRTQTTPKLEHETHKVKESWSLAEFPSVYLLSSSIPTLHKNKRDERKKMKSFPSLPPFFDMLICSPSTIPGPINKLNRGLLFPA